MERKESRNGLELIKYGAIRLKGNFSALFMGALAMVTPLVLMLLVPYLISKFTDVAWIVSIGVALFAIFVGPMQVGYIKYFNDVIDGKQPSIKLVYSQIRFSVFSLRTSYIAVLLLVLYFVGGLLWLVPGGICVAFFSMTLFFLEKYKYERLSGAMTDCAKQMIGNRLAMFSYKLIFYLVYALLLGVAGLCLLLIFLIAEDSMIVSWIVTVCSTIVFIFMYTMVTVYYHSCNQIFFEDTLMHNERVRNRNQKNNSQATTQTTTTEEKPEETKVALINTQDESVSKEKPTQEKVEKPETKKASVQTKKTASKKSSKQTKPKSKQTKKSVAPKAKKTEE